MKTTVKLVSVFVLILLTGLITSLYGQIKIFDNGNVGIKYTTGTPASKFVYNTAGESTFDIFFYTGNRSSSGGAQQTVVATGTGSGNHIYSLVGRAESGANNYLYGVRGGVWSSSPISYGRAYGVYGLAGNTTSGYNYGVYGCLYGTSNGTAVYGTTSGDTPIPGRFAGYFVGNVQVTGNIWASNITPSDEKLKTNIKPLSSSEILAKINSLEPVIYNLKQREIITPDSSRIINYYDSDSELFKKPKYGFIAQDVRVILPELVYESPDGTLGIDYTGIIPMLVRAIQEQQDRIEELEGIIRKLRDKFEEE